MTELFTLSEIDNIARKLAAYAASTAVIAFHGQMGAGKTTLISTLCKVMGVTDTIGSPTYSIINEYQRRDGKIIYHMDWYRLHDEDEAHAAGVEDPLYSGNLCLIEWPEKAAALLPHGTLHLTIEAIDSQTRKLSTGLGN